MYGRWACLLLLAVIACGTLPRAETRHDPEEYAVYSALLSRPRPQDPHAVSRNVQLVIFADFPRSSIPPRIHPAHLEKLRAGRPQELAADYARKAKLSYRLQRGIRVPNSYVLTTGELCREIVFAPAAALPKQERDCPRMRGRIVLGPSRVAFDRERKEAIVYLEMWLWPGMSGTGAFYRLVRGSVGGWRIEKRSTAWHAS